MRRDVYLLAQRNSARRARAPRKEFTRHDSAHARASAMKPVSAGSLASPISDTQCGAALTIFALTKTGSSFVRAHFEHAVSSWVLSCAHTHKSTPTFAPAVGHLLEVGGRSRPPLLGSTRAEGWVQPHLAGALPAAFGRDKGRRSHLVAGPQRPVYADSFALLRNAADARTRG